MSGAVFAAVMAVAVVQLLVPSPAASLHRIAATRKPSRRTDGVPLQQRVWLGVGVACLVLLLVPTPVGALAGAGLGAAAGWGVGRVRRKEQPVDAGSVPHALQLLAICLEAGAPMQRAVQVVAQTGRGHEALQRVGAQLALGRSTVEAWHELSDHPAWRSVARDVARSSRSGTALVELLRTHATELQREQAVSATRNARQVGVKSVVPLMACFLPAFVLVGVVPIIAGLIGDFFS